MTEPEQEKLFEDEVRRVARELWPQAEYDGAIVMEGRERDGIFETEECVHLIERTVSRAQQKAKDDAQKLATLAKKLQPKHPQKAIKCWFITREEPSPDQRTAIREKFNSVTALSFSQFQGKLIDVGSYLTLRMNYPFGSVRDPANPSSREDIEYVPLDLIEASTQALWSVEEIQRGLLEARRFIIFGDYGSGKSMTLREIFRELRAAYLKNRTVKFPLYINLRDHFGQTNPAEVLERHARNIGLPHPSHLVRAWRAGYVTLLIDGFDELTTLGIQGLWKRLHEVRYRAMEVVRLFIKDQPNDAGVILAGRAHFFDSARDARMPFGDMRISTRREGVLASSAPPRPWYRSGRRRHENIHRRGLCRRLSSRRRASLHCESIWQCAGSFSGSRSQHRRPRSLSRPRRLRSVEN